MPLPPLSNDESFAKRLWRNLRVSIPVAFWFAVLIVLNLTQTLSLVIKPISPSIFRRFNRWCASFWWGGCVVFADRFNIQLRGEVFNVMDNQTGYNIQNKFNSAEYGTPRTYYRPRRFQLTAAFQF